MRMRRPIYTFLRKTLYRWNPRVIGDPDQKPWGAFMRIAVLATALSSALIGLALADPAAAAIRKDTNIAPQELRSALRTLAADRRLQILYTTDTVSNRHT